MEILELIEKYAFYIFPLLMLFFYLSLYKAYKYAEKKGYNPIFPLGERRGLAKFITQCSNIQKEKNDKKMRNHRWAINISFFLFFVLFMTCVLK